MNTDANTYTAYTLYGLAEDARAVAIERLSMDANEDTDAAAALEALTIEIEAEEWAARLGLDARDVVDTMTATTFGPGSGAGPRRATIVDASRLLDTLGRDTLTLELIAFIDDAVDTRALEIVTSDRTPWMPGVRIDFDELAAYQVAMPDEADLRVLLERIALVARILSDRTRHAIENAELMRIDEDTIVADALARGARFCVAGCLLGDDWTIVAFCECDEARAFEAAAELADTLVSMKVAAGYTCDACGATGLAPADFVGAACVDCVGAIALDADAEAGDTLAEVAS